MSTWHINGTLMSTPWGLYMGHKHVQQYRYKYIKGLCALPKESYYILMLMKLLRFAVCHQSVDILYVYKDIRKANSVLPKILLWGWR